MFVVDVNKPVVDILPFTAVPVEFNAEAVVCVNPPLVMLSTDSTTFSNVRPDIETVTPFPRSWLNAKPKEPPIDRFVALPIDCISKLEPALIVISAFAVPTKPAARTEIIAISFFIIIYPFIDKLIVYVHKLMLICIEIRNIEQKCY